MKIIMYTVFSKLEISVQAAIFKKDFQFSIFNEGSFFAKDLTKIEAYTIATYCLQVLNKINILNSFYIFLRYNIMASSLYVEEVFDQFVFINFPTKDSFFKKLSSKDKISGFRI